MNPEKMRSDYGKLIYMLQDSTKSDIAAMLELSCVKPITTVYSYLKERGAEQMLEHENMEIATRAITPDGKTREEVRREVRAKEKAIKYLSQRYCSPKISREEIQRCLYS